MTGDALYPYPPHLSVAVYCQDDHTRSFARLCRAVEEHGATATGTLLVAPKESDFDFISDLADVSERINVRADEWRDLVSEQSDRRVVKAGFHHRRVGAVVAEYLPAAASDHHPMAASVAAGPLGIPEGSWSQQQRSQARHLAQWSQGLLKEMSLRMEPLYGSIAVESPLSPPSELNDQTAGLASEVFISTGLLKHSPHLREALPKLYPSAHLMHWTTGLYACGWAPFASTGESTSDIEGRSQEVFKLLSEALRAWGRS